MKAQKAVSAKVGSTFPGVTEDQLEDLDAENAKNTPDPNITVSPVNSVGIFDVIFNQEMLYP
jgi:hypothetical protein